VHFSYRLESEPVIGSGSYIATPRGAHQTEVSLKVRVEGSGPMAPMWEAMSRPMLPQLAKTFAAQLKAEIEKSAGAPASPLAPPQEPVSILARCRRWLRNLWLGIFATRRSSVREESSS
jgi:hypothetical protein